MSCTLVRRQGRQRRLLVIIAFDLEYLGLLQLGLQVTQPLMVIGEVNNGEDVPKIFPQEILPLEDAPRKFTKQVHLRLRVEKISGDSLESVRALTQAHPGKVPLLLCLRQPGGAAVFVEANERFNVTPSASLQTEADSMFGEDTYYAKVDTDLPEPQRRRYARNGNGNVNGQ